MGMNQLREIADAMGIAHKRSIIDQKNKLIKAHRNGNKYVPLVNAPQGGAAALPSPVQASPAAGGAAAGGAAAGGAAAGGAVQ